MGLWIKRVVSKSTENTWGELNTKIKQEVKSTSGWWGQMWASYNIKPEQIPQNHKFCYSINVVYMNLFHAWKSPDFLRTDRSSLRAQPWPWFHIVRVLKNVFLLPHLQWKEKYSCILENEGLVVGRQWDNHIIRGKKWRLSGTFKRSLSCCWRG